MDNCEINGANIVIHNSFNDTRLTVTKQRCTTAAYSMSINSIIFEEAIGRLIYVSATDWRLL